MSAPRDTREDRQSLLMLAAAPSIWAVHFLLSYATVSIRCSKVAAANGSLGEARVAIAIYTAGALAAIGATAWYGYRRHTFGSAELPHDADTPESRHRFLGFATLLLALLSGVATMYAAMAAVVIGTCI
jgi:hypothetical protein